MSKKVAYMVKRESPGDFFVQEDLSFGNVGELRGFHIKSYCTNLRVTLLLGGKRKIKG